MPSVRKKYRYPPDFYVRQYHISSSSVARYQKEGAPFDDPEKFARWIAQRSHKPKSMRMPPKEAFETVKRKVRAGDKEKAAGGRPDASEGHSGDQAPRAFIQGSGLRVEIARQEAECSQAYKEYREASDDGRPMEALAYHKIWTTAQKALRELSKDVPKSEREDDKVLPIVDVESSWSVALREMLTMAENVPATVALGLDGVDPEILVRLEASMMTEIVAVMNSIRKAPWIK